MLFQTPRLFQIFDNQHLCFSQCWAKNFFSTHQKSFEMNVDWEMATAPFILFRFWMNGKTKDVDRHFLPIAAGQLWSYGTQGKNYLSLIIRDSWNKLSLRNYRFSKIKRLEKKFFGCQKQHKNNVNSSNLKLVIAFKTAYSCSNYRVI